MISLFYYILFFFLIFSEVHLQCKIKPYIVLDELNKNVSILELVKFLELDVLIIPQVKWNINVLVFVCVCDCLILGACM